MLARLGLGLLAMGWLGWGLNWAGKLRTSCGEGMLLLLGLLPYYRRLRWEGREGKGCCYRYTVHTVDISWWGRLTAVRPRWGLLLLRLGWLSKAAVTIVQGILLRLGLLNCCWEGWLNQGGLQVLHPNLSVHKTKTRYKVKTS